MSVRLAFRTQEAARKYMHDALPWRALLARRKSTDDVRRCLLAAYGPPMSLHTFFDRTEIAYPDSKWRMGQGLISVRDEEAITMVRLSDQGGLVETFVRFGGEA